MLVELGVVEQRYQAVLEVLGGVPVIEVARRCGVARQTVHDWLRRYASDGLAGLADRSSRPQTCPHQMLAEIEVRITELLGCDSALVWAFQKLKSNATAGQFRRE